MRSEASMRGLFDNIDWFDSLNEQVELSNYVVVGSVDQLRRIELWRGKKVKVEKWIKLFELMAPGLKRGNKKKDKKRKRTQLS